MEGEERRAEVRARGQMANFLHFNTLVSILDRQVEAIVSVGSAKWLSKVFSGSAHASRGVEVEGEVRLKRVFSVSGASSKVFAEPGRV